MTGYILSTNFLKIGTEKKKTKSIKVQNFKIYILQKAKQKH